MVGGTTRIPYVQSRIREYFGKDLSFQVNPDECVADGAAILGNMMVKG